MREKEVPDNRRRADHQPRCKSTINFAAGQPDVARSLHLGPARGGGPDHPAPFTVKAPVNFLFL